jgi:hypothetical protein
MPPNRDPQEPESKLAMLMRTMNEMAATAAAAAAAAEVAEQRALDRAEAAEARMDAAERALDRAGAADEKMEALSSELRAARPASGTSTPAGRPASPARSEREDSARVAAAALTHAPSTSSSRSVTDFPLGDIAPTSKNYQSFLLKAKDKRFGGGPKDEVLQWTNDFIETGELSGVNVAEVSRALPAFLCGTAKSDYNEKRTKNAEAGLVWTWDEWKPWLAEKFNPQSKVMRKMAEYRRCAQGRRTVDEYYTEFLELRNFCASKGTDEEQKVQFLSGLHPELREKVENSLVVVPSATLDQTLEFARNHSYIARKDLVSVRTVHG